MQRYVRIACAFSVLIAVNYAAPAGQQTSNLNQQGGFGFSAGGTLNTTALVSTFNQKIQLLRQFCPQLFQVIDNVVQNVTSQIFSVVGRVILRNGLGGGSDGSGGADIRSRVSVVLPTFPPDEEDDVEGNIETTTDGTFDIRIIPPRTTSTTETSNEIALSADNVDTERELFTGEEQLENRLGENVASQQMFDLFNDDCGDGIESYTRRSENLVATTNAESIDIENRNSFSESFENNAEYSETTTETQNLVNINIADSEMELLNGEEDEITTTETSIRFDIKVVQNGSVVNTISLIGENSIIDSDTLIKKRSPASFTDRLKRVVREAEADQEAAASGGNGPDPADLSDIDVEDSERDKRYLPFGGEAHVSAGGGGGSGNFLFDIIRRTADGAARTAGTVYRMVAGTENLGIGLSATSTATRVFDASAAPQLIAGSGATEESDEKDNGAGAGGVAEIDVAKTADGYTEGIPGPITRLFVIANRGLANLVQDLILRLAQTSERIVNFKARLITALI